MKKSIIIFLLIICTPISLNASYYDAIDRREKSAHFHAFFMCKLWMGEISQDQYISLSDKWIYENFKKSEIKLIDQHHWDAANFLGSKLKQHNCSHSKFSNEPDFEENLLIFIDILLQDY